MRTPTIAMLVFAAATLANADNRGLKVVGVRTSEGQDIPLYENSYALLVGVSDYQTGQTPQYGKIRDPRLDQGDFVFLKRLGFPHDQDLRPVQQVLGHEAGQTEEASRLAEELAQLRKEMEALRLQQSEQKAVALRTRMHMGVQGRLDILLGQIAALKNGGSGEWDDEVKALLVPAFDGDGSGAIDTRAEIDQIPPEVYQVLHRRIREDRNSGGLTVTYGFKPGMGWVGHALGFSETVRDTAYEAMRRTLPNNH